MTGDLGETNYQANEPDDRSTTIPGIEAVILNWKEGENDPFSVFNATLKQHFFACGKNIKVIEISDDDWIAQLEEISKTGIEFALTWQGLASNTRFAKSGESIWDHLRIPLMCIHGDHPSHMPLNHQLESRFCFHLYTNAEFARYSNRHFRKIRSATVIDIPRIHCDSPLERRSGDYFVVAKNIGDPLDTERRWRQQLDKPLFDAYMMAAEIVKSRLIGENYVEIHDALDDVITKNNLEWLRSASNMARYHQYHSHLDHYLRSYKSVSVVTSLRDFPIRIYGRGWDRIAQNSSPSHVFEAGRNMVDSQFLYYTRFGLLDVSPSKGLHDRTRRAMANGSAFLSSANLEDSFTDIGRFNSLFFSFRTGDLAEKCASVVRDPDRHRETAQQFANAYHDRFHFRTFVDQIDRLAKLSSAF